MVPMMGQKGAKFFLPLIGTCAFMILGSNLLGLIPGSIAPTSTLNTTLPCALVILVTTHYFGLKEHGVGHITHLFGPVRRWFALPLMLLLFAVESTSHFLIHPATLSVRLMVNMYADHQVLSIVYGALPLYALGLLVCIVQTVVFCLLSTVYISMAIAHDEEGH